MRGGEIQRRFKRHLVAWTHHKILKAAPGLGGAVARVQRRAQWRIVRWVGGGGGARGSIDDVGGGGFFHAQFKVVATQRLLGHGAQIAAKVLANPIRGVGTFSFHRQLSALHAHRGRGIKPHVGAAVSQTLTQQASYPTW